MFKKDTFIALLSLAIIGGSVVFFYNHLKNSERLEMARGIAAFGPQSKVPETTEELMAAIEMYGQRIEQHVQDAAQTAVYWKILGARLAEKGMHRHAVGAFENAVYYNGEDPALYYMTGRSALEVAVSIVDFPEADLSERDGFFALAETSFLRAIELDVTYGAPRYSLGQMYALNLDRPEDAIVQLDRYLQISPQDIGAIFILARSYFVTSQFPQALELYERILTLSGDQQIKDGAQANIDMTREMMNG